MLSVYNLHLGGKIKPDPDSMASSDKDFTHSLKRRAEDIPQTDSTLGGFSPSPAKMGRPGEVFRCKFCNYKAEKLNSLNRHMRIHNNERSKSSSTDVEKPETSGAEPAPGAPLKHSIKSPSADTFCKECRIQFSSYHTYKCHKEHYCAQRRKKASADTSSAFAAMFQSPFTFADSSQAGIPSALQVIAAPMILLKCSTAP